MLHYSRVTEPRFRSPWAWLRWMYWRLQNRLRGDRLIEKITIHYWWVDGPPANWGVLDAKDV